MIVAVDTIRAPTEAEARAAAGDAWRCVWKGYREVQTAVAPPGASGWECVAAIRVVKEVQP